MPNAIVQMSNKKITMYVQTRMYVVIFGGKGVSKKEKQACVEWLLYACCCEALVDSADV